MRKLAKRLASPDAAGLVCPDHWSGPDWVLTDGPAVSELNAKVGFAPDPQQELGLDMIFAVGRDGLPASFAFCAICCRQNLKTGLFKQTTVGWLYVTEERRVVWSAHEMSTTRDAHKDLTDLICDSPALSRRLPRTSNRGIYDANGQERIELATGQTLKFKARTLSGGRGLSGDKVVLDEAFALRPSHVGSLLPTMTARPHGQVLYGSSAGMSDSSVLRDVRDRGRAGDISPRLSYLEWGGGWRECSDPDCTHPKDAVARGLDCVLDDQELWRRNNPTISTGRISIQTIADLRQELPPDEFARESMGRWDDEDAASGPPAIDMKAWKELGKGMEGTPAPAKATVVLHAAPNRASASIGVVGPAAGGRVLMMVHVSDMSGIVPRLKRLRGNVDVVEVALHPSGQAGALVPALKRAKIPFVELTHKDLSRGCATAQLAVVEQRLVHLNQPELTGAVAVARTRYVSEAEVWDSRDHKLDISPLVAGSTALHRWDLYAAQPKDPPPSPVSAGASSSGTSVRSDDIAHAAF